MANFFWPIGDRVNRVPLYCNQSNGSFHVSREHVFLFVCLLAFSQPHIFARKIIWYFIGVQYKVLLIFICDTISRFCWMMYSVTPWKEGLYQPLSSIMSSVNPNSLCKKSLNFDLSIFSPLASASNTPNKPITSSLVTEIAKIKIQFFYRLYITMQLYCYVNLLCAGIPVWDFIHTLKGNMLHRGFTTSH